LLDKIDIWFPFLCDYSLPSEASQKAHLNYANNYCVWINYVIKHYGRAKAKENGIKAIRRRAFCGLISSNNVCIGPCGELYKCEHNIGNATMVIGNIWQGRFFNDAETSYYATVDDLKRSKCSACEYLPTCMGGCANDRVSGFVRYDCNDYMQFLYKLKLLEGGIDA
jgi:radical SAM protein with 4Fe4S-binding SPASM domain